MKGILLISHGPLAKGMYETTKWFMGDDIPLYDYLLLASEDSPNDFDHKLKDKLNELDQGEGVIIIADLIGGTPCNRASLALSGKNIDLISGMNLSIVLQLLGNRLSNNYDIDSLIDTGRNGIQYVNSILKASESNEDDE